MTLALHSIEPNSGTSAGGNLVQISGDGFHAGSRIFFGHLPAPMLLAQGAVCYVQAPAHAAGVVDVVALDGEQSCTLSAAYRYRRPDLSAESDLTRLVRALLRQLKQHIVQSTSITVDVEYAGTPSSGGIAPALADLPALVLTGPELRENRVGSRNVGCELVDGSGNFIQYDPAYTVDLAFNLVGASSSTLELLNLLSAVIIFLSHTSYTSLPRDAALIDAGLVRWALKLTGDTRTHLDSPDGIKSFSCNFIVQGFDLGSAQPRTVAPPAPPPTLHISKQGMNP